MTAFFSVFPDLKLEKGLAELLKDAVVEKVTASRSKNRLRVYIKSPRLIHYMNIRKMEEAIGQQLFDTAGIRIQVIEKYELSEQYTPERLMSIYFDSFEAELRADSDLEANIFRSAGKEFLDASTLVLTVPDNFITVSKIEVIRDKLLRIFKERFTFDVDIRIKYEAEERSKRAEYAEETFQREVAQIVQEYEANEKAEKEKQAKLETQKRRRRKNIIRKIHSSGKRSRIRIFFTESLLKGMKRLLKRSWRRSVK